MYKISVPVKSITLRAEDKERIVSELRKLDAERVFLTLGYYELDPDKRRRSLDALKENCAFFKSNGFEVGTWIWTFTLNNNKEFRNMRSIQGTELATFMCPTDERFVDFVTDYIKDIAACGVELIMFDDDFRYGFLAESPACLCDDHIRRINAITSASLTREEICEHIVSGAKNKYRDAYIKVNGDALRSFAARVRKAVDEVDPHIRVGACTCMTSWDIDGTTPEELAKILAGNTKPFFRLNGAPYWSVKKNWGNSLQDVIELERMESSWSREEGIEIFAEGDTYPRPRSSCPASYLEGFDTAIRASGCTDGILKYAIDYYSNADYEKGYARYHDKNRPVYKEIDRIFGGKSSVGVRVYEYPQKLSDMVMPTAVSKSVNIEHMFFSKAARTLAANTIPTTYEGDGVCGIVFDENARHIPLDALKNGLIIDVSAAETLTSRGIDVGIESFGRMTSDGELEHFIDDGNLIFSKRTEVCDLNLKPNAEILSEIETSLGTLPLSYRYENAEGERFLVLNINTRASEHLLYHYARSRQYAEQIPWLSGNKLPAYVYGNPSLYVQCKQGDGSLAVGLWNFFADVAFGPVVELAESYSSIEFINCQGTLDGDKVTLTDIAPFGFAAFEVKK